MCAQARTAGGTGRGCRLTEEEAILAAIDEPDTSGHPGFPNNVVKLMMRARFEEPDVPYPYEGVLRFDRVAPDGEILHPYAARKDGEHWSVRFYLPFRQLFSEMPEHEFIALPIAAAADVRARADNQSTQ